MKHQKFPKIKGFHNVKKAVQTYAKYCRDVGKTAPRRAFHYRPKIKLHGTNAAIRVKDGKYQPQGRNSFISVGNDNCGFASWLQDNEEWVDSLISDNLAFHDPTDPTVNDFTLYGEWVGTGVQKGCAVHKIGRKIFCVFAMAFNSGGGSAMLFDPDILAKHIPSHEDVYILPWYDNHTIISVDWADDNSRQVAVDACNAMVEDIEKEDPWVKENFDVSGIGEGLVLYPLSVWEFEVFSDYAFKAKGKEHQVVAHQKPTSQDPIVVENAKAFAEAFVTENRCEQALQEGCEGNANIDRTGAFMKWINNDVRVEGKDELEANGLSWKQVQREVGNRAKSWFFERCES